jgi:uncharacterized membrane protein YcaP (DUF421 family)
MSYLRIILSCITIYLFIVIAIRLFGKKELAQLSVVDLVFILLISNAVQNAMVGSDSTLTGGLVAASSLFLINFLLKRLIYYYPKLGGYIQGSALLLIYKGELNKVNLGKAQISLEELYEAIREHGVAKVADVDLAILEVDGNISIISNNYSHRTQKKRKGRNRLMKNQQ